MPSLTYADYAALPDDGRRYELIDGELVVNPAPGVPHQRVVFALARILADHVESRRLGGVLISPLDVILDDSTTVQPDIVYLSSSREDRAATRGIEGPPSLAVEVLSPARPRHDLVTKRKLYARHRVPHYWMVDSENRTLEGLVLRAGEYETEALFSAGEIAALRPFPDLEIPLAKIWPPPLRR